MKMFKIIFLNTLILGTLISISSYSWFSMWMGLEINLLSFIPLMAHMKTPSTSESSLKYFITQAMASLILLFSMILMLMKTEFIAPEMNSLMILMLNSALLTKLGAAPFHFWFPEVMEGLAWTNCVILMTWQKIAPMILIMNNNMNFNFFLIIIIFSLIISSTMNFNQISLRKIMAYSSINHISWMISSMIISFSIWLIYFIIYSIITINIVLMFMITNSYHLNQILNIFNSNKTLKFTLMMNFLSLGGLPPFIGFLPKWLTINWMILNKMYFLTFILITFTLIMLYIYIQLIISSLILMHNEYNFKMPKTNNFSIIFMNFLLIMSLISCTWLMNFL